MINSRATFSATRFVSAREMEKLKLKYAILNQLYIQQTATINELRGELAEVKKEISATAKDEIEKMTNSLGEQMGLLVSEMAKVPWDGVQPLFEKMHKSMEQTQQQHGSCLCGKKPTWSAAWWMALVGNFVLVVVTGFLGNLGASRISVFFGVDIGAAFAAAVSSVFAAATFRAIVTATATTTATTATTASATATVFSTAVCHYSTKLTVFQFAHKLTPSRW